jgi:hypothetical protein
MIYWNDNFIQLFRKCETLYRKGNKDFTSYYDPADLEFLAEIGYQQRELFDFVEDFCEEGVPTLSTALLIAAVRRDYLQAVMDGKPGTRTVTRDEIPAREEEFHGIPYLPRILAKARAKLRGELDPDLMFNCGGDRRFLTENGGIHPADFLRRVWAAGDDDEQIAYWVKSR